MSLYLFFFLSKHSSYHKSRKSNERDTYFFVASSLPLASSFFGVAAKRAARGDKYCDDTDLMDAICIIVSGLRDADTTRTQNDNNEEAAAAEAEFSTHRCHNLLLHHHLSSQR